MKLFLGALWRQVPVRINEDVTFPGQLGIVAKKSDGDKNETWKAYMAVTLKQKSEKEDIDTIIKHGDSLTEDEAVKWFPDIELKYRR